MKELIESTITNKNLYTGLILRSLAAVVTVGLIFIVILTTTNALLAPFINADMYSFLVSQLFVGVSGILFGFSLLFFRSSTLSSFAAKLKSYAKPLLLTMLLAQLFILLGYLFFVLPGLVLTLLFFFYPFVVIEEGKNSFAALKRSCQLFKQVWFQLLLSVSGFYLLFILMGGLILLLLPNEPVIAEIISGTIVFPFEAYVFYRMYQRARTREKEK